MCVMTGMIGYDPIHTQITDHHYKKRTHSASYYHLIIGEEKNERERESDRHE